MSSSEEDAKENADSVCLVKNGEDRNPMPGKKLLTYGRSTSFVLTHTSVMASMPKKKVAYNLTLSANCMVATCSDVISVIWLSIISKELKLA